jgi:hypothetical protein
MSGKATAFVAFFTAFACHKIEKTYISTPFQSGSALVHTARTRFGFTPRVAFSGSPLSGRTGVFRAAQQRSAIGFPSRRAMAYRGVEQPGSSSGS